MPTTHLCIRCGREFRPRDADTVICPDCGGPPEAPAQPQGTALAEQPRGIALDVQPRGTVLMGQETHQRMCIICGQDFTTPDPQAVHCPQCRGEAPKPQPEIRSQPESRQPTSAIPARTQGTVAMPESVLRPAPSSSAADVPLEWKAGDVILDLYEVKGELGKGGMGVVYRVHHRQWNLDLAVKTPLPDVLQKAGGMENFIREAQAWVDLGLHPHIVTCYYVRRLGEVPRVFAECMEGGSLKNWMEDGRLYAGGEREALKRILDVAIQFAWGLGYAHEKGLVHQDVKPGNALMTPDGTLKVTDFGLVGAKGYTEKYAAPEQDPRLGREVSPRTDLWCWGVSVLEMFTGGVHWGAGSIAASVLESYLKGAPPEGIPPMPAALAELLRQCFQNDPDLRPASMDEVAERLMRLYEQETGAPYPRQKPSALDLRADSLNNKAVSLLDLGQEEEAVRCWQEALQADPAHLEANFNYGYYRWHKAELPGSEFLKQLQRLESTHGSNPEYWRLLGWVYLEQGYVEEVEEILTKRGVEDEALHRAHTAPDRPVGRAVRNLSGHKGAVNSVLFSRDGRYAISGGTDGTMRLWNVASGQEERVYKIGTAVLSIALSPDGQYALIGCGDGSIRLLEIATGKESRRFRGHTDQVRSVFFSSDGRYALSGSADKTVRVWEIPRGREVHKLKRTGEVFSVAFSPDGCYALGGEDGTFWLWNIMTGEEIQRFVGHTVLSVTCSSDGRYAMSASADHSIRLWELSTGQQTNCIQGHAGPVASVSFSSDGCYGLSGGFDNTVRLWNVKTGREIRCFEGHSQWVISVSFSTDGCHFLSGSTGGDVILWEMHYSPFSSISQPFPLLSQVESSEQATKHQRGFVELLRKAQEKIGQGTIEHAYLLLRQAERILGYERNQNVRNLIAQCGQRGRRSGLRHVWLASLLKGHSGPVTSVVFSPDEHYVCSGSWDSTVRLWDLESGKEVHRFAGHSDKVLSVAFSPDGRYIASGSIDKTVRLWDMETGREKWCLKKGKVSSVDFSPDGRYFLSGEMDSRIIRLWEVATGKQRISLMVYADKVFSAKFSPNGYYLLTGGGILNIKLQLWDIAEVREKRNFEGHFAPISSVVFAPDGKYILSGSYDITARLWDIESAQLVRCFCWPVEAIGSTLGAMLSVAFCPDGNYVLAGSLNNDLYLWEVETEQVYQIIKGHAGCVNSVAFSKDGRFALSGSGDGTIRLWEFDWEWDFPNPADWDEGARPYLDIFLTLHTPYGPDGFSRVGKPKWTEEDFQKLLQELGYRGYGWLRPEGVRRELEKMAKERR